MMFREFSENQSLDEIERRIRNVNDEMSMGLSLSGIRKNQREAGFRIIVSEQ
jgi:hypothetical protein